MIIGRGTIAQLLNKFSNREDVIIFASGVSNSLEIDENEFQREINLLYQTINNIKDDHIFVYFSTINIFDPSLQENRYVLHKKNIEKLITSNLNKSIIIRVPILIAKSKNPHLLVNYFIDHIKNKLEFVVFKNAYRYFINSTDFVNLSEIIINSDQNGAFNLIIHDKPYSIKNFVTDIENILKIKGIYEEVEKGSYFEVESNIKFILENNFIDLEKLDAKKYICHSLRLII
jgi:dTDP-4-dehydrorhamnose reductase